MFEEISKTAFKLSITDLDTLRSRVRLLPIDLTEGVLQRMKRKELVDTLLRQQFGDQDVNQYEHYCQSWRHHDHKWI